MPAGTQRCWAVCRWAVCRWAVCPGAASRERGRQHQSHQHHQHRMPVSLSWSWRPVRCRTPAARLPGACRTPAGRHETGLAARLPDVMKPGFHCVRTHWIRGFMAFQMARHTPSWCWWCQC